METKAVQITLNSLFEYTWDDFATVRAENHAFATKSRRGSTSLNRNSTS